MRKNEVTCLRCDGAGIQPVNIRDNMLLSRAGDVLFAIGKSAKMGVVVCKGCNGHGVVNVDRGHVCKYEMGTAMEKQSAVISR